MSMEKRGVIDSENTPLPATARTVTDKEASDVNAKACGNPNCCRQACGTDPLSKMAEAASERPK